MLKITSRHIAHSILSWMKLKNAQWFIFGFDNNDKVKYEYSHNHKKKEMGKLKTHHPIYYLKDNWEKWLNVRHTLGRIYLTNISFVHYFQISLHDNDKEMRDECNGQTNKYNIQAITYPHICMHHRLQSSNGNEISPFLGFIWSNW